MGFSNLESMIPPVMGGAIVLTVLFSELLKKADKKDIFKGYKVYFPLFFSAVFTLCIYVAEFITLRQSLLYWFAIFGISVFGYEAIVKRLKKPLKDKKSKEPKEQPFAK